MTTSCITQLGRRNLPAIDRVRLVEEMARIESRQGQRTDLSEGTSVKHFTEVEHPSRQKASIAEVSVPTYNACLLIDEQASDEVKQKV